MLHPDTRAQMDDFADQPGHALILVGPSGSGKLALAQTIAEECLVISSVESYPYALHIKPNGGSIRIDAIRQIEQFVHLKVPRETPLRRIVIIEAAHLLGLEAQNALLKNLEEPPLDTLLILTVDRLYSLLPTIRSRAQIIRVGTPLKEEVAAYFENVEPDIFTRAYAMSGGQVGLLKALLADSDHPLKTAAQYARRLLTMSLYERLCLVDEIARQDQLGVGISAMLMQMAHLSLKTAEGQVSRRWQSILSSAYEAQEDLKRNGQTKLVLTNLMFQL